MKSVTSCLLLLSVLFLAALPAGATIDGSLQMQLGNPSHATADTNNHDHYLIQRPVEAIDYSDTLGEPNWASWDLTADDLGGSGRNSSFYTDTNLPPDFNWVTTGDYTHSGYDRGHLCPSADRTDTTNDNKQVFYLSNIMPQNPVNNSGVWLQFENYCREQAQTNELLIICGPSGFGGARINTNGPVFIPDYVWKIAVVVPLGSGTALSRITSSTRVIALKIPNTDAATNPWPLYVTSARQIEVDTGFTFFTALPANVASGLRNKVDGQTNPPPVIYAFSPGDGATDADVFITGTNFAAASAVTFNGVSAAFTVNSGTQITTEVPVNGTSGFISVTTPGGTAISAASFTVDGGVSIYSGVLAGWDVSGLTNYGPTSLAATTNAAHLTALGLTRGDGVTTSGSGAAHGWGGTGFVSSNATAAASASQFATFGVAANAGYQISLASVSELDYRRSATGPANGGLQYQIGSGGFVDITNVVYASSSASGGSIGAIDLSGIAALQNVGAGTNVTFRIVNYGGTSSAGTWYVFDTANSAAPDLALSGTVTEVLATTSQPAAIPVLSVPALASGQFQFTLEGTAGSNYVVQATTNLAAPNWMALTTNAAPFLFIESNANQFGQRFYRGVVAP